MTNTNMSVKVEGSGKEYRDMTLDQLKVMVKYLNQGMSEAEAKAKAIEEVGEHIAD